MKLQHLMAIFLIIIIPIILILSMYIDGQLEVINLRNRYTTALTNATSDAMRAYESNTMSNDYSEIATSHRRDVNASINTFFRSLATNMGTSGYTISDLQPYIPAVLFTGYDGFYIYGKTKQTQRYTKAEADAEETEEIEEGDIKEGTEEVVDYDLQPYVYYSAQYHTQSGNEVTINYTLDNYVTIIGKDEDNKYFQKSGYVYTNDTLISNNDSLKENIICKIRISSAKDAYFKAEDCSYSYKYDDKSKSFQKIYNIGDWSNKKIIDPDTKLESTENINSAIIKEGASTKFIVTADGYFSQVVEDENIDNFSNYYKEDSDIKSILNDISVNEMIVNEGGERKIIADLEDTSNPYYFLKNDKRFIGIDKQNFYEHKQDIIRITIQENLKSVLANYGMNADGSQTNITYKLPIFTENDWQKIFSNITMIAFMQDLPVKFGTYNNYAIATSTGNTEYVPEDGIYYTDGTTYHRITCPYCPSNAVGYKAIDFERRTVSIDGKDPLYYYPQKAMACYHCIVESKYDSLRKDDGTLNFDDANKQSIFKGAVTRERALQYKSTSFLRN